VIALGIIALGEAVPWWHMVIAWEPYFLALLLFDFAISAAPVYLVTWRIARRFGWRGLVVVVVFAAAIGPPPIRTAERSAIARRRVVRPLESRFGQRFGVRDNDAVVRNPG
jgi:hypothetical protein